MQRYLEIPVERQSLAACLHLPAGGTSAASMVICCHGLTGTRVGSAYRFVQIARRLEELGIATLRFDFRGCGESDGRFEDVTLPSLCEDLRAVLAAAYEMAGGNFLKIGLIGSSFGAYTAARVAPTVSGLRCLAFIAPVSDPKALAARDMPPEAWEHLRKVGWVDHHGLPLGKAFFDSMVNEDVPSALAALERPVLIYHGTGDRQVPIEQGRAYEAALLAANVHVQFEAVDANDHGLRSVRTCRRIEEGMAAWFAEFLR